MKQKKYARWLNYLWLGIIAFCLVIYGYDMIMGDGDGTIARFKLNPLSILLTFSIPILLLKGVTSQRQWLANISLLLFSTLSILFVIEKLLPYIASQQAGVRSSIQRIDDVFPYTSLDSIYFKNYRPDCAFRTQLRPVDGGRNILHQINSEGMRGPEVPKKAAGERRILLVGDSYIQATQVDYTESVGPALDRLLPDSFSVLQHGFPSWSPILEWNWVLKKGLQFEPDAVVLFLYTNDFYSGDAVGDIGYMPYTRFNEQGEPDWFDFSSLDETLAGGNRNPWNIMIEGFRRLRLVRLTSFFLKKARTHRELQEEHLPDYMSMSIQDFSSAYANNNTTKDIFTVALWDHIALMRDTSLWSQAVKDRVELCFQNIKGMQQSLARKNIPLAVCLIPNPWQFSKENQVRKEEIVGWSEFVFPACGLEQAVSAFCSDRNLPLLDLYAITAATKAANPDTLLYCPSDPHWTVAGHQMAAEALAQFLRKKKLISVE